MIVLGIDPGFERMGCAVLKKEKGREELVYSVCLKTDKKLSFEKRLLSLGNEFKKLMNKFKPDVIAIEKIFFFKNQKTALQVAETKGMILYLAAANKIPIKEYTPLQIKMGLTGYGRAEKFQIKKMVQAILKIKEMPRQDDEADAIAIALCYRP